MLGTPYGVRQILELAEQLKHNEIELKTACWRLNVFPGSGCRRTIYTIFPKQLLLIRTMIHLKCFGC